MESLTDMTVNFVLNTDWEDLPDEVRQTMNFLIVDRIDQALDWALQLESEGIESPEFLAGAKGEPLEPIVSLN